MPLLERLHAPAMTEHRRRAHFQGCSEYPKGRWMLSNDWRLSLRQYT